MIKRTYIVALALIIATGSAIAQDNFSETLAKTTNTTPYEAAYILSDYQQFLPTFHATYFHLGNIYYDLIPTEHPIRDYNELKDILYRTRLYYGNCLHYAKGQTLKSIHYEGLPYADKRPEYTDLQKYINKRLAYVKQTSEYAQELYEAYYELVDRYSRCRIIFTEFVETYMREKTAHLQLNDADRTLLVDLQTKADSLPSCIDRLQKALTNFPIKDYQPTFRFEIINLYRLDGLTTTNMLQNDIVLWDYSAWAKAFIGTQDTDYRNYFNAINKEYLSLNKAIEHPSNKVKTDDVLLNRISRIDYGSVHIDVIGSMQQTAIIRSIAKDKSFTQNKPSNEYVDNTLPLIFKMQQAFTKLQNYNEHLQHHSAKTDSLIDQANYHQRLAKSSMDSAQMAFIQNIKPSVKAVTAYTNDISGETFSVKNMRFPIQDSIIAILPIDTTYLVVEPHQTIIASLAGEKIKSTDYSGEPPFIAAYKYTSDVVALVNERQVLFIETDAAHKGNHNTTAR